MITTKITGLSAQGNDSFSGMCFSKNDVAITMESTNVAEPGFKYIYKIVDQNTSEEYKFYVAPNAQNNGVFNCKTIFNELVNTGILYNGNNVLLHIQEPLYSNSINVNSVSVYCYEGWEIGGVFTEDITDQVLYSLMVIYGEGKQNFIVMGTNDTPPLALSQMYDNTIGFNSETVATELNLPLSLQNEVINWRKISRSNVTGDEDSAYNIISWIYDDGTYINNNYPNTNIIGFVVRLYDSLNNELQQFDINFGLRTAGTIVHIPIGLKNFVNGGYIDQSTANATAYYYVFGRDLSGGSATAKYGFWVDDDCKYNPVHLYWLNQMGGIDSFSFIKKNERSIDVERKRYKTYVGNYNDADQETPFSTEIFSRALNEREPIVKTYLNLTSDWLTESEFKYLKDLFRSKSVWMVDDNTDGYSVIPVVVEDNNYLMRRERNSHKYNQNLRLQIANDFETANIINSPFPIPAPVACEYYNVFANLSSSMLTIGTNVGNACNIVVNAATRDRYIKVSVLDALGATPIAGQTYYVSIDYNFTCPYPFVRPGQIELGNVLTGGGTTTSLQGLQTPGTPIIATGVWGTSSTTNNYFILTLPGWSGSATVTGNIYVTVGFGNCP